MFILPIMSYMTGPIGQLMRKLGNTYCTCINIMASRHSANRKASVGGNMNM